jgi:glutamate carboxypeptidase
VVPAAGELYCDLRADDDAAFDAVAAAVPAAVAGARLDTGFVRRWPGMDSRAATAALLERASAALGRPILATERGGASDASHMAAHVPVTIDGLGPRGGGAHAPEEFVLTRTLRERAEVALAILGVLLDR